MPLRPHCGRVGAVRRLLGSCQGAWKLLVGGVGAQNCGQHSSSEPGPALLEVDLDEHAVPVHVGAAPGAVQLLRRAAALDVTRGRARVPGRAGFAAGGVFGPRACCGCARMWRFSSRTPHVCQKGPPLPPLLGCFGPSPPGMFWALPSLPSRDVLAHVVFAWVVKRQGEGWGVSVRAKGGGSVSGRRVGGQPEA